MVIVKDFAAAGYALTYTVIKARHVGCPMHRQRVFLLACKRSSATALRVLQDNVPPPVPAQEWAAKVCEPWNADRNKPPMHDWLTVSKPECHTERLSMMGNAVARRSPKANCRELPS